MNKVKNDLKKWLPEQKSVRMVVATLFVTLGVYSSFPERGLIATFPLLFVFAFAASFVYRVVWFAPLSAGAIALFYGVMASFSDPFSYAAFAALSALAGALCAFALRNVKKKGKWKMGILFFFALILGIVLPLIFVGTPTAYENQRQRALEYLEYHYPDQVFEDMAFYLDRREEKYRAVVSYDNGGNTLTSELIFGERVEDGYRADYADYVLRRHASRLIEAFQAKELSVVTEADGLLALKDEPLPGQYGEVSESILPLTCFSVTFREEKPERGAFRDAICQALSALQEKEAVFGQITFYALDAGNVLYQCQVTPETDPEDVLSLITYYR